jgi:MFS transporter, OFA family, oxalate/formate antiporter
VINAIYALTPLSSALTLLASGWLTRISSPTILCKVGVGLFALGLGVALVWPSPLTFLVFFAILALGVGFGVNLAGALVLIAQTFPRRIGTVGGMLTASYAVSAVIEVPLISRLIVGHTWLPALSIVGVIVTIIALIAVLLLPKSTPTVKREAAKGSPLTVFRRAPLLLPALLVTILVSPLGTYATSQIGIYAQNVGLGLAMATIAVVSTAVGNTIGRLVSGVLSDLVGAYRVLFLTVVIDAVAGTVLWRATDAPLLVLASTMVGLTCGGLIGSIPRLAHEAVPTPTDLSATVGVLFAGISFGDFLGTLIGSGLGGRTLAWLVLGLLALLGLVIIAGHALFSRKALK